MAALWRQSRGRQLVPPPDLTLSQWADEYRVLSREASAEPGRWETDRAPYQRGILDAVSDAEIETVVVMSSSQVGKSEVLLNAIGYYAHQDPAPMLLVQPTIEEAEQWSKTRLAPMLRDTPVLADLIRDPTSRSSGNTLRVKEFWGGHITLVGANSPSGLAAKPIRVVLGDEIDRWPASAGTEGDPMQLSSRRTATFYNRKLVWVSAPTLKDMSRIEKAFNEGDRRRFWVPCPDCGEFQVLRFSNLRGERDAAGLIVPESVCYACAHCGSLLPEHMKPRMLAAGEWRAEEPTDRVASFHLSAMVSPWTTWAEMQREYNAAKGDLTRLQVFTNTLLGEPWEDRSGGLDAAGLESRRQDYGAEVPAGVGMLTMGVDVQDDRLEATVWGWGAGLERWRIGHFILGGDPERADVWGQLDDIRRKVWRHVSGQGVAIHATAVDSGAHTDAVYRYCGPRYGQRVYAIKGSSEAGKPIVPRRPTRTNKAGVPLFVVGTEAAKDNWYAALKVAAPGVGYVHFDMALDREYLEQLTAEKLVRKQVTGRWIRRYELGRGMRSEALDCAVYALVALLISLWRVERLGHLAERLAQPVPHPATEPATREALPTPTDVTPRTSVAPAPAFRTPRLGGGWVNAWRR